MKHRSTTFAVIAGIFVVLALVLYGCGGGGYGGGGTAPASTVLLVTCPTGTADVSIVSQIVPGFSPSSISVPVNTIVKWTDNDATPATLHTVTSTTVPLYGTFDSGQMSLGTSVCFKFTSAGTFNYHCSNHPMTMIGVVNVP
jgi:plastocyanin